MDSDLTLHYKAKCGTLENEVARLTRENAALTTWLERIADTMRAWESQSIPCAPKYFATEHGRLIARAASEAGKSLKEVSLACGYSDDYVTRVCWGSLPLIRSASVRFGNYLGIDLSAYTVESRKASGSHESDGAQVALGIGA